MWPNPQETEDFVAFTEEILNEELHFLCRVTRGSIQINEAANFVSNADLKVDAFI